KVGRFPGPILDEPRQCWDGFITAGEKHSPGRCAALLDWHSVQDGGEKLPTVSQCLLGPVDDQHAKPADRGSRKRIGERSTNLLLKQRERTAPAGKADDNADRAGLGEVACDQSGSDALTDAGPAPQDEDILLLDGGS